MARQSAFPSGCRVTRRRHLDWIGEVKRGESESRKSLCQLEGKGRKYVMQVTAVSRTERGRSKEPVGKRTLSNGLRNRRLSYSCEAIQPENRGFLEVFVPRLDLIQYIPCAPETASAIAMFVREF